MCQVQRVVNTCGHRNSHVVMACHFAKAAIASAAKTGEDVNSNTYISLCDCSCGSCYILTGLRVIRNKIDPTGYDGRTEPYCLFARIWDLESAVGFECLVPGCGGVD